MPKITLLLVFTFLAACSFDSKKDESTEITNYEELKPEDLSLMDTDGDGINDFEERERGLNPFVANIPELKVRFLQNYNISVNWKSRALEEKGLFSIDTRIERNDPSFKYRIGEVLVKNKALNEASRIGRFSSHSWGNIQEDDLTRIIYPDLDTRITERNALLYSSYFDDSKYEISTIDIELENTIKLESNSIYSSIKNLELNFYFYDYRTERYELLATKIVERHFNRNTTETFFVTLENIPVSLIEDNYFKRGEFIISEVKDFEIPESNSKYSELMRSIKNKTVEVIVNTPLETKSFHVAPFKNKNRFVDILENLFPNQFKIENDELLKIGQFESNLSEYTHLFELKDEDKKGRWFIFTSPLRKTYLDHEFKNGEVIVLSYVTGKELSEQTAEKIKFIKHDVSGLEGFEIYPLGNISPNSVVDFQLQASKQLGEEVIRNEDRIYNSGASCGRNCINWNYECHILYHEFKERNSQYEFQKDLSNELSQLYLIINEDEFHLKTLVEKKKVEVYWNDKSPHFRIRDISQIKEIFESNENVISLKVKTLTTTTFEGVNLVSIGGKHSPLCAEITVNAAFNTKIPIYEGSHDFHKWEHWVNWSVIKKSSDRTYKQPFTFHLSSTVNNFFN